MLQEHYIKKIKDLSLKYQNYTANNLSKLIKIKSFSKGEKEVQLELMRQMEIANFDDIRIDGIGNIIGRIGNGKRILCIDGHVDTVDTGNISNWNLNPFSGYIKNGYVYGRGAVDQKGGVASFITSGRILKELNFNKDITIYFIGSIMEEDCNGLSWKYIIEENKILPDIVICTEPTNLNLYRGQRGRMEIEIKINGVSSNLCTIDIFDNTIYKASRVCLEIAELNNCLPSDSFLGKGSITVTEFVSSKQPFCPVVDFAKIHIDRRLTKGETRESALSEIQRILHGISAVIEVPYYEGTSYTGLNYGMEKYFPPWQLDETHQAVVNGINSFKLLYNKCPYVDKWTFSTNGVATNGIYKIPTIGFGPGNEEYAHAPNEKVPINDLVIASAFYAAYASLL